MSKHDSKFEKSKKLIRKLQDLSEWQKIVLAILATLVVAIVFMLIVNFLNSLIQNYN